MTTRRQLLSGAFALPALAKPAYAPQLVLQPYVWTQQLHTEKKSLAEGMEDIFASAQQAGFHRMELMSSILPPELRAKALALTAKYKIDIPILYISAAMWDYTAANQAIGDAVALAEPLKPAGLRMVTVNLEEKPGRQRKSDEELAAEAYNLNKLGAAIKQRGLRLMIHNHDPQMANGAREWRNALHHTDPSLVWFCVDVHWVYRGHQDPMTLVHEAGTRIASLHLRNSRNGVWMEDFGDGDIDYRPIAAYLRQLRYRGYLEVELAYEKGTNPSRPLTEDLRRSRIYAERIFGIRA
ncbi:MAG: TIM barrel protein [Bryobacteraceae bacterium]